MRSPIDTFWSAVERWHGSTKTPRIAVECSGGGRNWPFSVKGKVDRFSSGEFIRFILDDGKTWGVDLHGCELSAVSIPLDLAEMEIAAKFSVRCEEENGGTSTFLFTELRDFGKPN
jgi:hypothetical protein